MKNSCYFLLLICFTFVFTNCSKEESKDNSDAEYTITINAKSELENKYIKDGTTAFFVEAGRTDTIFSNIKDEQTNINVHAESGREITGVTGIKENKGHYATKQNITLMGDEELLLEMKGKSPTSTLDLTTTYNKETASNIKITINPGNVITTTDNNGKATIAYENETNEFNEINTNANIKAESTPSSNIQTTTQNYTRTIDEAIEEWNFELTQSEFEHNYNGTVSSSLAEKIIKDGIEKIGLVYDSEVTDTTWTNINNETYAITKISGNENENYTLVFKGIPGHTNKNVNGTSTSGTEEINNVELIGLNYSTTIPVAVVEQGTTNGIEGATVDETETTDEQGKTTVVRNNLETDVNNIPLTSYATNVSVEKTGFIPKSEELTYVAGENSEKTIELTKETLTNIINYLTNVSSGTALLVEKGTTDTTFTTIGTDGKATINYEHPQGEENTLIIGARSAGKIPEQREITAINNNTYNETFNLEDEPSSYTLDLIITDVLGDNILTGKTINVKEPDGDTQTKTVNSKNTNFIIEGTYDNGQKIKIWLTPDTEYDGLTGTINQSLKNPLTSVYDKNETGTDTLAVIIGDIDNKTAYVSFMDKTTRDDPDIQSLGEEGGNSQWNYINTNGEREQNIYLLLNTEQGTPTPNDIKQFYKEAVTMLTNKYTTNQGLKLIKTNYDSIPSYSSLPEGTILLLTDDTQSTPAGVKIGNMPETFNQGLVYLRTFDNGDVNTAASEVGEVIIPLKDKPSAENEHYFIWNGGEIEDVKLKPLRIALMYKGLTMPDPTP